MLGSLQSSISASPTRDSYRALARDCLRRVLNTEHTDPLGLLGRILTNTLIKHALQHHQGQSPSLESILDFCGLPHFHELIVLARLIECIDASSIMASPSIYDGSDDDDDTYSDEDEDDNLMDLRDSAVARFKSLCEGERAAITTEEEKEEKERAGLFRSRGRYALFAGYLEQFVALEDELEPLLDTLAPCLDESLPALSALPQSQTTAPLLRTGEVVCEMGPVSCCSSVENFKKSMFLSSNAGSPKTLSEDDVARVLNYIIM